MLWAWERWQAAGGGRQETSRSAVLLGGVLFALDLGVWHWSIMWTSVANSTLLANLAPIVVTIAGWLLWKQKVTRTFLVGMIVAIAGMSNVT